MKRNSSTIIHLSLDFWLEVRTCKELLLFQCFSIFLYNFLNFILFLSNIFLQKIIVILHSFIIPIFISKQITDYKREIFHLIIRQNRCCNKIVSRNFRFLFSLVSSPFSPPFFFFFFFIEQRCSTTFVDSLSRRWPVEGNGPWSLNSK